jgi:hypothetical protein
VGVLVVLPVELLVTKWTSSEKLMPHSRIEVVRVGEGIKLVLNENAVRFNTNKSSLTLLQKQI